MSHWHPWRHAAEHYPDVTIYCHQELPGALWGLTNFKQRTIWLCRRLQLVHRRCTLTHEIVHLERGPVPTDPAALALEENIVDEIAARRLITLPQLVDGLRRTRRNGDELAGVLWVDRPTLRTRMETLDPIETAELEHALGDLWTP